ncbi:hypothetical protein DFP72DRAFT_1085212 [Ephemerocybe angulata]|uniref:Uncharacterized protein n=1 Tax=Ephemerocybe angulata TaxID=980116 RepID=A0A8H6H5Z0_9AGAR|nr:hypothetical protein DFP72DRAFT_1085212 [Tulosesus angulatus]
MPGNHPNPVPYAPPVGVPTVKAIYYSPPSITGVRRFENIPYVGTGRRILSLRSVMKGYPAVSIKSTIVNLVTGGQGENPRKVNVFRIFTRRDPAFLANPSLWALTGGVEWEGDLCIVRAGSQRGKDYVSITSAKEVQMAINAVILFLEYTHRYNRMPTLLNFAEYGMDLPFVNANDLHGHYVWNVAGVPGLLPVHAPGPNIVPPPYAPPPVVAAPVAPPPAVAAPVAPPPPRCTSLPSCCSASVSTPSSTSASHPVQVSQQVPFWECYACSAQPPVGKAWGASLCPGAFCIGSIE